MNLTTREALITGILMMVGSMADLLTDDEVFESLHLDAQGQGCRNLAAYLLTNNYTANEIRGHHRLMKWLVLTMPAA